MPVSDDGVPYPNDPRDLLAMFTTWGRRVTILKNFMHPFRPLKARCPFSNLRVRAVSRWYPSRLPPWTVALLSVRCNGYAQPF